MDDDLKAKSPRFWIALAPAMSITFLASIFYFNILADHPAARVVYGASKAVTLIWPVFCVTVLFRRRLPRPDLRRSKHWRALPAGVGVGLLIVGLMVLLMNSPLAAVVEGGAEKIRAKTVDFGVQEHYWAFALSLSLGNSLFEEYFWRWFVYGHLREAIPDLLAVLLAGAAFASHHIVIACQYFPLPWGLALGGAVGVGGAIWSVMMSRQKTLLGAWVSHVIVDLGIFAVGHRLLFP